MEETKKNMRALTTSEGAMFPGGVPSYVIYLQGLGLYMDFCWNSGCVRKIVWHIVLVLKFHLT